MAYYGFARVLKQAILEGIWDCGDAIFSTSQTLVPVDKGHLKKSGRVRRLRNGVQIAYRTPYAAAVEFGWNRHGEYVKRHWVRAHYRKYHHFRRIVNVKTGAVQTHTLGPWKMSHGVRTRKLVPINIRKKMKNKIYVSAHNRGPFVRRDIRERLGEHYLTDAVTNHIGDISLFIQNRIP